MSNSNTTSNIIYGDNSNDMTVLANLVGKLSHDGYIFDQLIDFMKTKILSIISIVFVTYTMKTDDPKTKANLSIKYVILSLLGLSIILLVSGFIEFIYTVKTYESKQGKKFGVFEWIMSILVGIMYLIICTIVFFTSDISINF